MANEEVIIEQRKYKRYQVKGGAFVQFIRPRYFRLGKSHPIKKCPIVNISMGGLAVQYIDSRMWSNKYILLSILMGKEEYIFDKVPFKTISDFKIADLPNSLNIRKRCVQFGKLSFKQKSQLEYFILKHTIEGSS
jgi:hypothetical protein